MNKCILRKLQKIGDTLCVALFITAMFYGILYYATSDTQPPSHSAQVAAKKLCEQVHDDEYCRGVR